MAVLEIVLFAEGRGTSSWVATVANSSVFYTFNGTDTTQQAAAVNSLASAMRLGQANVIAIAPQIFGATAPPGMSPAAFGEQIATSIFETTQSLSVSGEVVFDVVEGAESLWVPDMLADAGAILVGLF